MRFLLAIFTLALLPACTTVRNDGGGLEIKRTYDVTGAVTQEVIEFTPPAISDEGSSVAYKDVSASFGSSKQAEAQQVKDAWPQRIFLAVGGLLLLGGLYLGYVGHFKLMGLAFTGSAVIIGLSQLIEYFGMQIAVVSGVGVAALLITIGWLLWRDYKSDGIINGK